MRSKIAAINEEKGIQLGDLSTDFKSIMEDMTATAQDKHPKGSFRRLFWDEQVKALRKSDARQIRWHPALIRWCLHLKFISSGAYHAIRNSGLLTLPSERTLRDYTNWIRAGVGFNSAVDEQLLKEINVTEERHKYIMLCWDEMKIKEGLVFNKHTCELVGFTDIGDINNDLTLLEQDVDNPQSQDVASHILLFMVRGLFTKVNFPYVHFATRNASADTLYPIVWETVERLQACGLTVMALTSDGASPNRKFFKMHGDKKNLVYKTSNPFEEDRYIYFFSDVPHLLKTTRNCFSNSFSHMKSRALWVSMV